MLRRLPTPSHPDLLIGTATGDDAAVWRVAGDRAMVATVDVFTPIVDDPRTWGAIAAANSASDVYAMGGQPLFALNIAGWPRDELSLDLLADVFEGASEVAERGRWMVVGGHTIDSAEPFFGQSVMGDVHPDRIISNNAAQPGDVIILTKPIGTGIVTTAAKHLSVADAAPGGRIGALHAAAVASMTRLNDDAAVAARTFGVRAGTDITGFGLLGHLHKLALGSGVAITLAYSSVPFFEGVVTLLDEGFLPGGTTRNLEFVTPFTSITALTNPVRSMNLLADPQTSGGLALCVAPDRAQDLLDTLLGTGHAAAIIATVDAATVNALGSATPAGSLQIIA